MHWIDDAFILSARAYGESGLLVQLLAREHGRHAGLVRGGQGRKARLVFETGNRVEARWGARLAEHLGTLRCELTQGLAALFIDDPRRLACLAAAAALAESALPEREPAPRVFDGFAEVMDALTLDAAWSEAYVRWEIDLLAELGFGLDLTSCAVTGATQDLAFVSPRTGRAVSRAAGAPYEEKLLKLPPFLLAAVLAEPAEIVDGLALAGHFLERHVFAPEGRALPPARQRFLDRMRVSPTISGTSRL
jgi:DNA repair protein RecO (recombination protein O)